ncbi:MAG: ABC transporter ATP-binding protein [Verrucomicrobiae bacterium]
MNAVLPEQGRCGAPAIDVRGVTKSFDGKKVIDDIAIRVAPGEIYGFLGPNGSGKTTFIRMLCGLLKPDAGEGTCLGVDFLTGSREIKNQVGYMTQRFSFYEDLTVFENLDFVARVYGLPGRRALLDRTLGEHGLAGRRNQLAGGLSGGWKQRLALAACMLHEPKLLLLDEPTAGVDPKARRDFWESIHKLAAGGLTVLITTHYMDEAERCHRIGYLAYGHILATGTVPEVIAQSGLHTWSVAGPDLPRVAARLEGRPGVEQVVPFGTTLHISGTDPARLEEDIRPERAPGFSWQKIPSSLEDVFIHLMESSKDNFP